jgi:hypothetical protein
MNWQQQAIELWGERWKSTLALTAGITKRTVQRWCAGVNEPPAALLERLKQTYEIWK